MLKYTYFLCSLPASVVLLTFAPAATWPWMTAHAASTQSASRPITEQPITDGTVENIRMAQNADGFTIDVTIDAKKNQSYIKADNQFSSFVYTAKVQSSAMIIQPASENIMGTWKGDKTLKEIPFASKGYFEDPAQFGPIFLVVDLNNTRATPVQVKNAYLDVSASASDLQPYLEIGGWGRIACADGSYNPKFSFTNQTC
jgi:hypothetical protein